MARPPRIEHAGGVFHLVARGNERALVFRDDRDRERFLEILEAVADRYRWRVLAYCLMGNHFHLLVMTLEPTLARGMRQLNGVYAQWFNRRQLRVGHLFQGRDKAVAVQPIATASRPGFYAAASTARSSEVSRRLPSGRVTTILPSCSSSQRALTIVSAISSPCSPNWR